MNFQIVLNGLKYLFIPILVKFCQISTNFDFVFK